MEEVRLGGFCGEVSHRVIIAGLGMNEGNHLEAKIFNQLKGEMPGSL